MIELETQVVKIRLGDTKQATSYVYTLAETVEASESELYMICELPLFNPAAASECERIAQAIAASLKRSYRKNVTSTTFENALAIINEELGKLVSLGKTHWLGKLNAVIAVKYRNSLNITSAGKISALLYRDGNFSPLTEQTPPPHPLKTFENFSEGKIRLGDLLVLSTSQLFNHISVDRVKNILRKNELPDAAQEIITTLQDAVGPEVACGTILALQVEPGLVPQDEDEVDLSTYMNGPQVTSSDNGDNWLDKLKTMSATAGTISKNVTNDLKEKVAKRPKIAEMLRGQGDALSMAQSQFKKVSKQFQPEKIKGYSRQKKFFLISIAVLLIALIANITIAKYSQRNQNQTQISGDAMANMEKLVNDANAALLYGDEVKATQLMADLKNQLNGLGAVPENQTEAINNIRSQATTIENKLNNVVEANVESLGSLGNANHLITLPSNLATETNRTIVSYNRSSGNIQDNALRTSEPIMRSAFLKGNQAVIYNGTELLLWNFSSGVIGGAFSDQVPKQDSAAGLKVYPTNNRVYMIDKARQQVMSFQTSDTAFSTPTVSIKDVPELANASDLAIDGNIYIAAGGTILKFNSGTRQEFIPAITGFSPNTKIYTQTDFGNLYVLDPGNKRIIVLNKQGGLVQTLTSDKFNDLRDFTVDEKGKAIYILNNNNLLRVKF